MGLQEDVEGFGRSGASGGRGGFWEEWGFRRTCMALGRVGLQEDVEGFGRNWASGGRGGSRE